MLPDIPSSGQTTCSVSGRGVQARQSTKEVQSCQGWALAVAVDMKIQKRAESELTIHKGRHQLIYRSCGLFDKQSFVQVKRC